MTITVPQRHLPPAVGREDSVDHVAVSDVRGFGEFKRGVVSVIDNASLDQQGLLRRDVKVRRLGRGRPSRRYPRVRDSGRPPQFGESVVQRANLQIVAQYLRAVWCDGGPLESQRSAISEANTLNGHHLVLGRQIQLRGFYLCSRPELSDDELRGDGETTPFHVLGETHEGALMTMDRRRLAEGSSTLAPDDHALLLEVLHRGTRRHPAHAKALGDFGLRGEQRTWCRAEGQLT